MSTAFTQNKYGFCREINHYFGSISAKESVDIVCGYTPRKLLVTSMYAAVAAALFGVSVPTFLRGLGQPVPADVPPVVFREWADRTHHLQVSSGRAQMSIGTAQLRHEEESENARECLIVPKYSLDNCPFICKVLFMKTSIQLRNKIPSFS